MSDKVNEQSMLRRLHDVLERDTIETEEEFQSLFTSLMRGGVSIDSLCFYLEKEPVEIRGWMRGDTPPREQWPEIKEMVSDLISHTLNLFDSVHH